MTPEPRGPERPGDATSVSLLSLARSNDAAAWDRLVALYAPLVMHWCRKWGLRDADINDVFQDVFIAVAANLGRFQKRTARDTFRGWLRTIARSKVCDHYRRQQREPRGAGGSELHLRMMQTPADEEDDGESDQAEQFARDSLLGRALDQIRSGFREPTWRAFWWTVVDGRETRDVADELSMTPGAVRVARSRVLQRLRAELGELIE